MKLLDIIYEQQGPPQSKPTVGFKSDYTGQRGELEKTFPIPQKIKKPDKPAANSYSQTALQMIMKWEKFSNKNYLCPSKRNTIGYGTRLDLHPELRKNACITENKAIQVLKEDLNKYAVDAIKKFVRVPLAQNQFDALCSLIYNIGRKRFVNSNLLNGLNQKNWESVKQDWLEYRIGDGKVLQGLVNRRHDELKLFFT